MAEDRNSLKILGAIPEESRPVGRPRHKMGETTPEEVRGKDGPAMAAEVGRLEEPCRCERPSTII